MVFGEEVVNDLFLLKDIYCDLVDYGMLSWYWELVWDFLNFISNSLGMI